MIFKNRADHFPSEMSYVTKHQSWHERPYILRWLLKADMPSSEGEDGK
jgi:hypothetical protein